MFRKNGQIIWLIACGMFVLSACSSSTLHEARQTVSQADSVWAEGGKYSDSVSLAQAYTALHVWRALYADDYAHVCYHYGRLLREKDDPVSAMQAFINATHSRTHDYHILGRVYSNMGGIAHMASEFPVAYRMYERSGEMYLRNKDTLLYYYDLNNMAYEMAEQRKKEETLGLLNEIEKQCTDKDVRLRVMGTKAEMYLKCKQYDSALYCARKTYADPYYKTTSALVIAQIYSYRSEKDSATLYANYVLEHTDELYNKNNALYILTNHDNTKDINAIRETSANRSDTQKLIEVSRSKNAQAVQLLEQDLERKPDMRWLYAVIAFICLLLSCGIFIRVMHKRKLIKNEAMKIAEQNRKQLQQFELMCSSLRRPEMIKEKLCWNDYKQMCAIVDANFAFFIGKLQSSYSLSEKEIRLSVLVLIDGFTGKQMAELLFYAESGIRNLKSNTAKKIGTNGKEFRDFLIKIAFG